MSECDRVREILESSGPTAFQDDQPARAHLVACPDCFEYLETLAQWGELHPSRKPAPAPVPTDAETERVSRGSRRQRLIVAIVASVVAALSLGTFLALTFFGGIDRPQVSELDAIEPRFAELILAPPAQKSPEPSADAQAKAARSRLIREEIAGQGILATVGKLGGSQASDFGQGPVVGRFGNPPGPRGGTSMGIAGLGLATRTGEATSQPMHIGGLAVAGGAKVGLGGKSPRRVGAVRTAAPTVAGSLDSAAIARVVRSRLRMVQDCYERALKRKWDLAGKVEIEFEIGPDGRVERAAVGGSTLDDPAVGTCTASRVRRWRFPRPLAGSVTVTFPFVFTTDGGGRTSGASPSAQKAPEAMTPARDFLSELSALDGVGFKAATGYWANTYIPGDPKVRHLQARLADYDRQTLAPFANRPLILEDRAQQVSQPYDPSDDAALAVFITASEQGITDRTRMVLQVGLQGTPRSSGRRPPMNVSIVVDLGAPYTQSDVHHIRNLVHAFAGTKNGADRFSLIVAGASGGMVVPDDRFDRRHIATAMAGLLADEAPEPETRTLTILEAMQLGVTTVAGDDDPAAPLGSSLVILVAPGSVAPHDDALVSLASESAVNGLPVSVIGLGDAPAAELDLIALAGQGNRRHVGRVEDAEPVVQAELNAVARVVARAVRLRVRLKPGVQLVDVLGSHRLDDDDAERVRRAEGSIDRRVSRNMGIAADRGDDEDGIQIVIPSYYAGDSHVVLLDVVVDRPGPVASLTVRYKDMVHLENGVARAELAVAGHAFSRGRLQDNVLKNVVAQHTSSELQRAAAALAAGDDEGALQIVRALRTLVAGIPQELPSMALDPDIRADLAMLSEYEELLAAGAAARASGHLADSLRFAGLMKVQPRQSRL